MKKFSWMLAGLAALTLFASNAVAQDDSDVFNGGSYEITPPKGWIHVAGYLSEKELKKLPENVREHYSIRNTDVIFMNLSAQDSKEKGFKDSLNIVTISENIPLSEDLVKEMKDVLTQQYQGMFTDFEMTDFELSKLNGQDVLVVKGNYTVINYKVKMEQTLVPHKDEALVLTCTYDSTREDAMTIIENCQKAVKSLTFN
ncbi:MAG: hypothetical protein IJU23_10630 [Proteobacteria bacterium]|nr:hypothetical protein [Pseudomonadota bacterium]